MDFEKAYDRIGWKGQWKVMNREKDPVEKCFC